MVVSRSTSRWVSMGPVWWLTGPNYGPGSCHDSLAEAKAVAQHWNVTGERPAPAG